jgi:hypothetical protein
MLRVVMAGDCAGRVGHVACSVGLKTSVVFGSNM